MKCLLVSLCILLAAPCWANSDDFIANEVDFIDYDNMSHETMLYLLYKNEKQISIATGTKKLLYKAPAVAEVISAGQIEKMGANSLTQVIESVTGIHVYPSTVNRLNDSYSIRGIHTNQNPQILLLIDNIPVQFDHNGGRWNQFFMGVELIERIEIIRGPGSAVYGADAFSGVINVVTKNSQKEKDNVVITGTKTGSFASKSAWFLYQPHSAISVSAEWFKQAGDDSRIIEQDYLTQLQQPDIVLTPRALHSHRETLDLKANLQLDDTAISVWYINNLGGTGAGANQVLSDSDRESNSVINLAINHQWQLSPSHTVSWNNWYQKQNNKVHFQIYPSGVLLPRQFDNNNQPIAFTEFTDGVFGEPGGQNQRYSSELIFNDNSIKAHSLRMAIGYKNNAITFNDKKNFGAGITDENTLVKDGKLTDVTGTPYIFTQDQSRRIRYISLQDE